jgi:hypothetical protein
VQENRRALATAQARAAELELQGRMEEIKAEHLRREAAQKPEHGDLRSRAHLHAQGKEALNADPRLASARKALNDANAVMQAKMKEMPEYKAREQARKAFDAAQDAHRKTTANLEKTLRDTARAGSSSIQRFIDVMVVMDLHELAPVGCRPPGRRDGWWLERLAKVFQNLPDWPRIADRKSAATGGCQQCEGQGWFRTGQAT